MDNEIKCTTDYSIFKFHKEQRGLKDLKVIRMMNSMKKRGFVPTKPIEINENFEIIDGQHRFQAAKNLGIPVYYVFCKDVSIEDVREMGRESNKWDFEDYCTSYIRQGKEAYIELMEWKKKADLTWSKLFRTGILYNSGVDMNRRRSSLYDGTLSISEEGRRRIGLFLDHYKDIRPLNKIVTEQQDFIGALAFLVAQPKYKPEQMMKRLSYQSRNLVKCPDTRSYLEMLLEIYNYMSHKENILAINYSATRFMAA